MPFKLFFPSLLIISTSVGAQSAKLPVSVAYPSLTVYSSQQADVFSFRFNTAALATISGISAGVYSERRFLLQELSSYSLAVAMPVSSGAFGMTGDYYGSAAYNETSLGLGYGRKLGEAMSIGLGFHYHRLSAAGYGTASVMGFDAGVRFQVTTGLQTGMAIHNPVGMKFGKSGEEKLPAVYSAGLGWDASPELFIGGGLQKTEDQNLSIQAGLQYVFAERLLARCGIASGTSSYYLGFGVKMKSLRIDITATFHPSLGTTPGMMLQYFTKP